jgi:hypothetical protein
VTILILSLTQAIIEILIIEMRVLRNTFAFSRTNAYLQRFKDLEEEVTRREREVIEKKEQVSIRLLSSNGLDS